MAENGSCPSELRRVREINRKVNYFKKCGSWFDAIGIIGILGVVFSYSAHVDDILGFSDIPFMLILLIMLLGIAVCIGGFYLGSRYSRLADEYNRRIRNF